MTPTPRWQEGSPLHHVRAHRPLTLHSVRLKGTLRSGCKARQWRGNACALPSLWRRPRAVVLSYNRPDPR